MGSRKRAYLGMSRQANDVAAMRRVKAALDPTGYLIVTGLVPPLNGTSNPNGLIAKPGIVTGLVPPLNGTSNPNGLIAKPGIVLALSSIAGTR